MEIEGQVNLGRSSRTGEKRRLGTKEPEAVLEGVGDAGCDILGFDGFRAGEMFINGLLEEREPAFEVRGVHWKHGVFGPGAALIGGGAKEH
ncbi:MAG: hypothetical protein JWQ71_2087 [Pedosphaera sp.]|nr:hypothetical protein [Pedosphaera sp.]